ncbi:uncharacterized protein [Venturia canescens]|nr:uncharacterized protein LOC122418460 isoform X2 [Venturia canescens]
MDKRKRRSLDEIHEDAELLYERHGFDGEACLAKNICQALHYVRGKEGVMAKVLKLLTQKTSDDGTRFDEIACQRHSSRCPLELVGVNDLLETSD